MVIKSVVRSMLSLFFLVLQKIFMNVYFVRIIFLLLTLVVDIIYINYFYDGKLIWENERREKRRDISLVLLKCKRDRLYKQKMQAYVTRTI